MVDGAIVDYHSVIGREVTHPGMTMVGEPWQLGDGQWVVKLKGKPGGVAIEACSPPPYDVESDRSIIKATRRYGEDFPLALGEGYDFGQACLGKPNGATVHDVLTEPVDGAPMFERCLPQHAAFVIAAWVRWPAALREIERLRAEIKEVRRG